MKNTSIKSAQLIAESYMNHHHPVYQYIYYKINNKEDAEDISQDVFVRLMDYKQMLRPDTVKYFIYTIARNLVTDYLRRHYKKQEVFAYIFDYTETSYNRTESEIIARDLLMCEKKKLAGLPFQRRKIYAMNRFQEKTSSDIAKELCLSQRTVENHLFISRKEIRNYIKQCI